LNFRRLNDTRGMWQPRSRAPEATVAVVAQVSFGRRPISSAGSDPDRTVGKLCDSNTFGLTKFTYCLIGLSLAVLTSCTESKSEYEWYQRLTVDVNTPSGVKSGTSTIKVQARELEQANAKGELIEVVAFGEATIVETGKLHFLIALLSGDERPDQRYMLWNLFPDLTEQKAGTPVLDNLGRALSSKPKRTLAMAEYPLLITLQDRKTIEPDSAIKLDPSLLTQHFGSGYSIASITFEITDGPTSAPVLLDKLYWLRGLIHFLGQGKPVPICGHDPAEASSPFCAKLQAADFIAEGASR
jgi:hypothetical protein